MSQRRRLIGRRDVYWTVAAFLVLQLGFLVFVEVARPGLYDRESAARLALLREQVREKPGNELLLVVGSSRIGLGFTPGKLSKVTTEDGRPVIPINFSHLGAGPRMNLIQVRRALQSDVTPRWIVLELIPGGLAHEDSQATMTTAADLPALLRHTTNRKVWRDYLRNRLNPFFKHRQGVLREIAPAFVTKGAFNDLVTLEPLGDDLNWMRIEDHGRKGTRKQTELARLIYSERLKELRIDSDLDGATQELLSLCREKDIRVVLLMTPENSLFRSWYSRKAERRLARYLGRLEREYGTTVVDARAWVGDEHFCDPHHLKLSGAHVFTERLGEELIRPLVAGRFGKHSSSLVGDVSNR